MSSKPFMKTLALVLVVAFVMPTAFLAAPPRAQAVFGIGDIVFDPTNFTQTTISAIEDTLTGIATPISAAANVANQINQEILQPLAFVLSGNLMKALTASVIGFVIGKANGTGVPQFVTDVQKSLQTAADSRAFAYISQFSRNSNSPFSASIASSLRNNYLQKTTLAGYWAANMNTLARSSPTYGPGFLNGNWSQGGVATWFALTTRIENNPYMMYANSRDQLATVIGPGIGGATGARVAQLGWGQGIASWCGPTDSTLGVLGTPSSAFGSAYNAAQSANADYGAAYDAAAANPGDSNLQDFAAMAKARADTANKALDSASARTTGINPGDPCTNKDGTPGTVKTPGSVITATLNKVLGGQQDTVVRMGNIGPQITSILGNIATVLQTASFAAQIIGNASVSGATGGLLGSGDSSAASPTPPITRYQSTPGNLGVTNTTVYQSAATLPVSGASKSSLISQYQTAWTSIGAAATAASTTVATLINYCVAQQKLAPTVLGAQSADLSAFMSASTAQINAAQAALGSVVAPALAQAATAAAAVTAAQAMTQKVQTELVASTSDAVAGIYATDLQTLQTMVPTAADVGNALQQSQVFGLTSANPSGSLNVSGGSLLDKVNLINTNAAAIKASRVCVPTPSDNSTQTFD